jgi:hypothetical protein
MGLFGPDETKPLTRLLPERSYLYYKYPQKSADRSVEFYFPFLENIDISESQRPNLGTYDLLGRAGNLFSYHGARSRDFQLRFYITLPHVFEYIVNYGMNEQFTDSFRYFSSERENEKMKFYSSVRKGEFLEKSNDIELGEVNKNRYYNKALSRYGDLLPPKSEIDQILEELNTFGRNVFKIPVIENVSQIFNLFKRERPRQLKNAISYFMLLVNVIRTSTLNNSKNTSLGPPTIYINHGTMYNNIPCVCTNYNIRLVSENGYDLKTMNPKRVEVTMSFSENRTGDFGGFKPFSYIQGENLAGWEAVMEERTLDPWNSTFGDYDADLRNLDAWETEQAEQIRKQVEAEQIRKQVVNELNSSTNLLEFGDSKEAVIELPLVQDYDTFNNNLPVGLDPTVTTIER